MTKRSSGKSILANFGAFSEPVPSADDVSTSKSGTRPASVQPVARVGAGVIGATQRSLSDLREQRDRLQAMVDAGVGVELDPELIDPSPFPDRLPDDNSTDFERLKKLIAEEGQKLPIQVRKHPGVEGRYQVVYGHRRWRAARELGIKLKATVLDLSDVELVVAQGIENAARQDLSWIERALFAGRMDEAGIRARDIRAALSIDDPELARLRSVCRGLPGDVIEAIGRAPKVGRPRWVALASAVAVESGVLIRIRETLSDDKVSRLPSDDRFKAAFAATRKAPAKQQSDLALTAPSGEVVGKAVFSGTDVKLTIEKDRAQAFASFLEGELPELIERFFAREGEK